MKTIKTLKNECINNLKKANIDEEYSIVNSILKKTLKKNKIELLAYDNIKVNIYQEWKIKRFLKKIINGIPIQYITNNQEFMGCDFFVNKNVLIPRNDTEILVEKSIEIIKKISINREKIEVLDMCTGSGCIPIGILVYFKKNYIQIYNKINIVGVDISKNALKVAQKNVKNNGMERKIQIVKSNLFKNLPKDKYDLIISNPPYIETKTIELLDKKVKSEPHVALDGGKDGLYFYNEITNKLKEYLKENSCVVFEIGYNQGQSVTNILKLNGFKTEIIKDLSSNDRVIVGW